MAEMHDNVMQRIETAINNKQSIEACWLCYSCFESRILRTLEKVSERCNERRCYENHSVGIKTRIECIKRLSKLSYAGTELFDNQLLILIVKWCQKRNTLVHALVSLNNYYGMDDKFLQLAKEGKPLVEALYHQTTAFRNNYYKLQELPCFPEEAVDRCRLIKRKDEAQKEK